MKFVILAGALALCSPAQAADPASLDSWAGEWIIKDPSGATIGQSRIIVQAPNAMLYEERRVGNDDMQPLWFENSERDNAWVQLFVGASGRVRSFKQMTPAGQWPMIMTGDFVLRDGRPASFRLTASRMSVDENRRLLEMSTDRGASWSTVFDYTYRRKH